MTVIYDVLLKSQGYAPVTGYYGEPKYICVYYDESKRKALSEMGNYVKKHGFTTPDGKYTIADVILRERKLTGEVISDTPYCELFDVTTDKPKK